MAPGKRCSRYTVHLIAYAIVALGMVAIGAMLSSFAVFNRESILGKIWLAGPTAMCVGLVLCGKVFIDLRQTKRETVEEEYEENEEEMKNVKHGVQTHMMEDCPWMKNIDARLVDPKLAGSAVSIETDISIWNLRESLTDERLSEACIICNPGYTLKSPQRKNNNVGNNACLNGPVKMNDQMLPATNNCIGPVGIAAQNHERTQLYQGETFLMNDKQYLI